MEKVLVEARCDHMHLHIRLRHDPLHDIVSEIDQIAVFVRDIKDLSAVPDGQVNAFFICTHKAFCIDLFRFLSVLRFFVFVLYKKEEFVQRQFDDSSGRPGALQRSPGNLEGTRTAD